MEKLLEKNLRIRIKRSGGLALKFIPFYYIGMPDRIVLMPGGKIYFAEIKSPGRKPSQRQKASIETLERLGFNVSIIDSAEKLERFLRMVGA